jgi:hypothetical protein
MASHGVMKQFYNKCIASSTGLARLRVKHNFGKVPTQLSLGVDETTFTFYYYVHSCLLFRKRIA